ncbi:MAG: DNA alkylation repair protein [Anaerolineales bacterium]
MTALPTIDLSRLKQEAAQLAESFSEPPAYLRGLVRLLQNHAVPVHRQGQIAGMRPVLSSYAVPPPLLKQLHMELAEQAQKDPEAALAVADGLWAVRSMETRQLAARLLGAIEAKPKLITDRLESWAFENREPTLSPELTQHGTANLCAHFPEELVTFAQSLLESKELRKQSLALGALQNLLTNTDFANLPLLFDMLSPVCKAPDRKLRPDLADLLLALGYRSPQETEYFLQQCLETSPNTGIEWITRQVMMALPANGQARLRALLKL